MKPRIALYWIAFLLSFPAAGQPCNAVQNLSSAQQQAIQPLYVQLEQALRLEQLPAIDSLSALIRQTMGSQAGLPETAETYYTLTTANNWLSLPQALQLSRALIDPDSAAYAEVWRLCKGQLPPLYQPHSVPLRAGAEICAGLLKIADRETDLQRKNRYSQWAMRGLDSLRTMQLPDGSFPFPDLRPYNDPVFGPIIQNFLNSLGPDSVNVLQNGWIISDRGTGEFKFDAGVICGALAEAHDYTFLPAYLQSAQLAAAYLDTLPFSLNYNYNTFVAYGLAKTHGQWNTPSWLQRSAGNLRYAVLPGQIPQGSWADGHNARSSYHGIILQNSAPLLALLPSSDPLHDTLARMLQLAARHFILRHDSCGSSTGFKGLLRLWPLDTTVIPQLLHDSITQLTGRYINEAAVSGRYLDVPAMGLYLELLGPPSSEGNSGGKRAPVFSAYPNPFSAGITFVAGEAGDQVQLDIIDITGRETACVYSGQMAAGGWRLDWSPGPGLAAGLYFARLQVDGITVIKPIVYNPSR